MLEAPSGKEALIAAWRDAPDLILFDPVLSDIEDEDFISKIRSNVRTSKTPLIAISSDPGPMHKEICMNAGVTEYIVKSSKALHALKKAFVHLLGIETPIFLREGDKDGLLVVLLSTIQLTKTVWDYLNKRSMPSSTALSAWKG